MWLEWLMWLCVTQCVVLILKCVLQIVSLVIQLVIIGFYTKLKLDLLLPFSHENKDEGEKRCK